MSPLISEETMKHFTEGAKSVASVTAGLSSELINEAINLFIIESLLHVLKFAAVFVVFMIIKKYIDTMMSMEGMKIGVLKAFKTCALVASIVFFTAQSFPHIINVAKAMVAPKIFLLEKGAELIKR